MKVGLKYCGGCREGYDRIGALARIRERLGEKIEFVSPGRDDTAFVLVVTGCATACADVAPLASHRIRYLRSPEDVEQFIAEIVGN